jgi:cytosine/adenosine deaminase-related metal-dependent hydrolase
LARAAAADAPVAFHLAETPEELELLSTGTGPLRMLLEDFGAWEPGVLTPGLRPLHYLQQLGAAGVRGLVIHGNYLADDEMALLAAHANRLSVVYCPRTHTHFGHPPHPWRRLRAAGVNVALGTDSRASNPDLNLWADACHAVNSAGASPVEALQLATQAGALALGLGDEIGTLTPGKRAEFALLPIAARTVSDPHELLLEAQPQPFR